VIELLTAALDKSRWFCTSAILLSSFWGCSPGTDSQPRVQQSNSGGGGNASTSAGGNASTSAGGNASTSAGGSTQTATNSNEGGSIFGTTDLPQGTAGICGKQDFQVAQRPANVLLVLDRSKSMIEDSTPTKWSIVVPTLQSVVNATSVSIAWGLKVFPKGIDAQCTATTNPVGLVVPVAPNSAGTVSAAIGATDPQGNGTPTASALNEAVKDMQAVSSTDPKYILLATDGEPSCTTAFSGSTSSTDARSQAVAAAGAAFAAGFPTFVVGITTPDKTSALQSLNDMAVAGGKPRATSNPLDSKYYIASSAAELEAAMISITSTVATCRFDLAAPPPNTNQVNVRMGDEYVHRDTTQVDGWNFNPTGSLTLELFGSACEKTKSMGVQTVQVEFVCEGDVIY
jgi:hypothetical protein